MFFQNLLQDLDYGTRQLRQNPLFALTAILTIGIGIGATTTVFTVANALLLRDPVAVADPDRLIDIGVRYRGVGFAAASYPNYVDIAQRATTLSGVYAFTRFPGAMSMSTAAAGAASESVFVTQVSTNYFTVLGAVPAAGRLFVPSDDNGSGGASIAVLSHRFWTRRFNNDPGVVGQTLRLNGQPFILVGVAAEGFQGTGIRSADMWIPRQPDNQRAAAALLIGARLKPGVSLAQATAELDQIGRALELEYPVENRARRLVAAALSPIPGETIIGLLACYVPARRATRIDAMRALRNH